MFLPEILIQGPMKIPEWVLCSPQSRKGDCPAHPTGEEPRLRETVALPLATQLWVVGMGLEPSCAPWSISLATTLGKPSASLAKSSAAEKLHCKYFFFKKIYNLYYFFPLPCGPLKPPLSSQNTLLNCNTWPGISDSHGTFVGGWQREYLNISIFENSPVGTCSVPGHCISVCTTVSHTEHMHIWYYNLRYPRGSWDWE